MEELTVFLQELAVSLGTTVEKLWGVLLRQAPISGTIDLMLCIFLVVASVWVFRFVQKKTTNGKDGHADWEYEGKFFGWFCTAIFIGVAGLLVLFSMEGIVTAFLNPEYWALTKVLAKCR